MRKLLVPVVIGVSAYAYANAKAKSRSTLDVVSSVDLNRYVGKWYEIARLPEPHQEECVSDVTATYTLVDDQTLKVVNECRRNNGQLESVEGFAQRASEAEPAAKLKVRFAPNWLWWLPLVWGDYWIIDLAPDYSYAMVGTPDRKYLWLLSRTTNIDEGLYQQLVSRAEQKGFDLTRLRKTQHTVPGQ